jgi:hypothetical protein
VHVIFLHGRSLKSGKRGRMVRAWQENPKHPKTGKRREGLIFLEGKKEKQRNNARREQLKRGK